MSTIDRQALHNMVPRYRRFLASEEGQQWSQDRAEKDQFFVTYFSEAEIDNLEEGTLRELIHILWAFNSWTNKDWLLQEMLRTGLPTIRSRFKELLYGDGPLDKRFNGVTRGVRMMGAASVSEILAHHDSGQYPIWNQRSKQGLVGLGVDDAELPKSAQITGEEG